MNLNLERSTWKRVAFGDVVRNLNVTVKDPAAEGIDRVIAMEHLDPGELKINRWGSIKDGTTFTRRVKPGQTLFGKRRAYQRKAAYAEFDAITSGDILVFEADPVQLLPDFLPFLVQSDGFYDRALGTSAGSLSPRTNWRDLCNYEFDLPPVDEQKRLADLLWALECHGQGLAATEAALRSTRQTLVRDRLARVAEVDGVTRLDSLIESGRPVTYGILMPGSGVENGVPVIKVKDFPDGRIREGQLLLTTEEIAHEYRRSTLKQGDLVISIRGTIGRLAEVPASLAGANITQDSARLSVDSKHDRRYVRLALESEYCQEQIRRKTTGTRVLGLNIGALRKIEVPAPSDKSVAEEIIREAEALAKAIDATAFARSQLMVLRAALSAEIFGGAE